MKQAFKAKLFNGYKFDLVIMDLSKVLGLKSNFDMVFAFNAPSSVLYIKQKSNVDIGRLSGAISTNLILNGKSNISIGGFDGTVGLPLSKINNSIGININNPFLIAELHETLPTSPIPSAMNFASTAFLINHIQGNKDINIGSFWNTTSQSVLTIYTQLDTDLSDVEIFVSNISDIAKLSDDFDFSFESSVSNKLVISCSVNMEIGTFVSNATSVLKIYLILDDLDPNPLTDYDSAVLVDMEGSVIE